MNEHHPQNFIDAGLGSLDPSDRFDYSTIADRAFAVELSQYPAIIRASKEKALTEVCNIGRCLADARKKAWGSIQGMV